MSLFENSGAVFSKCKQYRYKLWRTWSDEPPMLFLMLNPSTADEVNNDPTVERCERRARSMGYGSLRVANIFALRSTYPQALYSHSDPIGIENNNAIIDLAKDAGLVVCAWGGHGIYKQRGAAVLDLLRENNVKPHYLKLNNDGTPGHPLYVSYDVLPKAWTN